MIYSKPLSFYNNLILENKQKMQAKSVQRKSKPEEVNPIFPPRNRKSDTLRQNSIIYTYYKQNKKKIVTKNTQT